VAGRLRSKYQFASTIVHVLYAHLFLDLSDSEQHQLTHDYTERNVIRPTTANSFPAFNIRPQISQDIDSRPWHTWHCACSCTYCQYLLYINHNVHSSTWRGLKALTTTVRYYNRLHAAAALEWVIVICRLVCSLSHPMAPDPTWTRPILLPVHANNVTRPAAVIRRQPERSVANKPV